MALDLKFEIDWGQGYVTVQPPRNWQATAVEMTWTSDHPSATIRSIEYEWVGDNAKKINQHIANGVTGAGNGIYEPPKVRISACLMNYYPVFEGLLDLTNPSAEFSCDVVKCPLKEAGRIDWLNEYAVNISWNYLFSIQAITKSMYKEVPYCLTIKPDYGMTAVVSVSTFIAVKELYETTTKLAEYINTLVGGATTAAAQAGTSAPSVVATIANVVLYTAYLALIIIALLNLINDLLDNIWQKKKYKLAMRVADIFTAFCANTGLTFYSSILGVNKPAAYSGKYVDTTWMPKKIIIPTKNNPLTIFNRPANEKGNAQAFGYPEGSCADFFRDICEVFNAEIKIVGNSMFFEERHQYKKVSGYKMPNVSQVGYTQNLPDPHGTNAMELAGRYKIGFQIDESDKITTNRFEGTSCEVIISPIKYSNVRNVSFGENVDITFACALAKRKENLNKVETALQTLVNVVFGFFNTLIKLVNKLISAVAWVINLFGGNITAPQIPTLPTNVLNNRIGWMELSDDTFNTPKIFIGDPAGSDWKIHQNSETWMSASGIMANFHGYNLATRGNQWITYKNKEHGLCCTDAQRIKDNNYFTNPDNLLGKYESLLWEIRSEMAVSVNYRINTNFTNNLKETIVIDQN